MAQMVDGDSSVSNQEGMTSGEVVHSWLDQCKELWLSIDIGSEFAPCFYKVLPEMRYANNTVYDPMFFTFGPYHAKLAMGVPLSPCDRHKVRIARALTNENSFLDLQHKIKDQEADIRKIYGQPRADGTLVDDLQGDALAYLLALDSLTVAGAAGEEICKGLMPENLRSVIWRDAMLLEQQLPLFILKAAIESIHDDTTRTLEKVVEFYAIETSYPFKRNEGNWKWLEPSNLKVSMLSHIHYGFLNNGDKTVSNEFTRVPSASKLQQCGIHFQVGDGGFTGISFDATKRALTLPEITVFDSTKAYLLNLVAHEAVISAFDQQPCPVTSFILLMDFLIDKEEDVSLLVEKKVIHNQLGSDEQLADMWNTLTDHLPISFTAADRDSINAILDASHDKMNKCWAGFRHTYCDKKPWLVISIIAASLLLLVSITQTIFSILQFLQGKSK